MEQTRILVVEDERIVALDIQKRLRKLGYEPAGMAQTGEQAVQMALDLRPDLVLMDIHLQSHEMDGIEAASRIQAQLDLPVIFVTAYADEPTLRRARVTEPYGYLLKPFEERTLQATIEMALYKHRMERRLRESERWLAATLQSIHEAVIAVDGEGRVRFMNPLAEQYTGWPAAEAVGQELGNVFRVVDPQSREPASPDVLAVLQTGEPASFGDRLLIHRQEGEYLINDHAAPLRDDRGTVDGLVLSFRDVTGERAAETRLREQEKMALAGRLAGGIAHHFNNMLTCIVGFAELSLVQPGNQENLRENLRQIIAVSEEAAALVQQVLDFSRQSVRKKRRVPVSVFVYEAVQRASASLPGGIHLQVKIDPACTACAVSGDAAHLRQALLNVIQNSVEAMPDGGDIWVSVAPVEGAPDGRWVRVSVHDQGHGIAEAHLTRIFEPFFSTRETGRGMGLAQTQGIVSQHGGSVEVQSRVGEGTIVSMVLPVVDIPPERAQVRPAAVPSGQGETVLVLESETSGLLDVMHRALEYLGYRPLVAGTAEAALDLFHRQRETVALALVDVVTPELNGRLLVGQLLQLDPVLPLVLIVDREHPLEFEGLPEARQAVYLPKPWSMDVLARTMAQALGRG
ncbi:MAG: response regulator [Chloroflexi bacterium]|nr:MAG: response regulator [Chloroflexota bacterium]